MLVSSPGSWKGVELIETVLRIYIVFYNSLTQNSLALALKVGQQYEIGGALCWESWL